jgi:hypothetical protein
LKVKVLEKRNQQLQTTSFLSAQNLLFNALGHMHAREIEEVSVEARPAPNWSVDRLVNLEEMQLEKLPPEIFLNKNLNWLDVSNNKLVELPQKLASSQHLKIYTLAKIN